MEGKKTYIGYDLGDGETITDLVVLDADQRKDRVQTLFTAMTMPDSNDPGKAMPTVYGYDGEGHIVFTSTILAAPEDIRDIRMNFKRCPSDLMTGVSQQRREAIQAMVEAGWPNAQACPELYTEKMRSFIDGAVSFTNAIFDEPQYKKRVRDAAVDSEEIVFCVGHPTKWTPFDVAIYAAILRRSVLGQGAYVGKRTTMLMAAESRAAFLYVRDKATSRVLQKDTCALLIDVGSSTIDLTAMTSDSRNHQYNSGSNYLGARCIDFLIRKWYLDRLAQDQEDWNVYVSLMENNPAMKQALTLSCRMAKETIYSTTAGMSRILFADFAPVRITRADIDEAINRVPVSEVLRRAVNLPKEPYYEMGGKNWKELFEEFLRDRKAEMTAKGIRISRIILTGSASKMPFVPEIVAKVYPEIPDSAMLSDMNPSRSISMGLALVGPSNEKSKAFQEDLGKLLEKDLPELIAGDIPQLADSLSDVLTRKVTQIVKDRMYQWRRMEIGTLEEMTRLIKQDCSEDNLNRMLKDDKEYTGAIEAWTVDVVGQDIAVKLHHVCDRYGVGDISLENLNVMKVGSINIGDIRIDPTKDIASMIAGAIALIAGVVAASVLPTVLAVLTVLISTISSGLATVIYVILASLPGVGWTILTALAGIAVVKAAISGLDGAKRELANKLQGVNLPQWVRDRMSEEKLNKQLADSDMRQKIRESILEKDTRDHLVTSITKGLRQQVAVRAEDIKYVIESK